jgi:hypothetical protein
MRFLKFAHDDRVYFNVDDPQLIALESIFELRPRLQTNGGFSMKVSFLLVIINRKFLTCGTAGALSQLGQWETKHYICAIP